MKASLKWSLELFQKIKERETKKLRLLQVQSSRPVAQQLDGRQNNHAQSRIDFVFAKSGECFDDGCYNNLFRSQNCKMHSSELIDYMNRQYNLILARGCQIEWPSNITVIKEPTSNEIMTVNEHSLQGTYIQGSHVIVSMGEQCLRIGEQRVVSISGTKMRSKEVSFDYSHVLWHAQYFLRLKSDYVEQLRESSDNKQIKERIYVEGNTLVVEKAIVRRRGRPRKLA